MRGEMKNAVVRRFLGESALRGSLADENTVVETAERIADRLDLRLRVR